MKKKLAKPELYTPGYLHQVKHIQLCLPAKKSEEICVLDFGMGWGYWCMAAQSCGYQVMGFEMSEVRRQFAKDNGIETIRDFAELGTQQFDFINAEQVFEHLPKPLQTLQSLVAYLNPNGVVRIAVPDGQGITRELTRPHWQASKNVIHPLEHINCFTHSSLLRLGEQAGLRVIPQPVLITNVERLVKDVMARFYRRFFGTVLYFRKQ